MWHRFKASPSETRIERKPASPLFVENSVCRYLKGLNWFIVKSDTKGYQPYAFKTSDEVKAMLLGKKF